MKDLNPMGIKGPCNVSDAPLAYGKHAQIDALF